MTQDSRRRELFLEEMRLGPVWQRRAAPTQAASADEEVPESVAPITLPVTAVAAASALAQMEAKQLPQAAHGSDSCTLCQRRSHSAFGNGSAAVKWLFVGDAASNHQPAQEQPFDGPAGALLDNMLAAIGLSRHARSSDAANVYLATIINCDAPEVHVKTNAAGTQEIACCLSHLQQQIARMQPTMIVALGKAAALSLMGLDAATAAATSLASLRERVHHYANVPLVVTYDPAYLLRRPEDKRLAWRDLCLAMTTDAARESAVD